MVTTQQDANPSTIKWSHQLHATAQGEAGLADEVERKGQAQPAHRDYTLLKTQALKIDLGQGMKMKKNKVSKKMQEI